MGGSVPPKLDPVRRNVRTGPLKLPAEGRKGPIPEWPLEGPFLDGEERAWNELWRTPQSVAWEKLAWIRVVGRYCRVLLESERPRASSLTRAEARQLEDKLGLTPKAMRVLLWEIVDDELAAQRQPAATPRRQVRAV